MLMYTAGKQKLSRDVILLQPNSLGGDVTCPQQVSSAVAPLKQT